MRLQNTIEALLLESESKFVVTKQAGVNSKVSSKYKQMIITKGKQSKRVKQNGSVKENRQKGQKQESNQKGKQSKGERQKAESKNRKQWSINSIQANSRTLSRSQKIQYLAISYG